MQTLTINLQSLRERAEQHLAEAMQREADRLLAQAYGLPFERPLKQAELQGFEVIEIDCRQAVLIAAQRAP